MSKYIMHNGTFYEVSDEELMHWKYIKKEKLSDGTFRYYYDQSELDKAKSDMDTANKLLATREKADAKLAAGKGTAFGGLTDKITNSKTYRQDFEAAQKKAKTATEKYYKMATNSFLERTISKGYVKVANFLTKLFSKK